MQKELNSDVARFATHIKLVLQQISLLLLAKICCRKYRLVLLFATKSVHFVGFTSQRKLVWQKVKKLPSIAWLSRNCTQSEVSIHAICKNLICCKTGLNVGSRTRNVSFFTFLLPTLLSLKDVKTCKWCQAHQNTGFYKTECLGVR